MPINPPLNLHVTSAGRAWRAPASKRIWALWWTAAAPDPFPNVHLTTLPHCRPRLAGTLFQKDLGTLLDKSQRVEELVAALGEAAGLQGALVQPGRWLQGRGMGGWMKALLPSTVGTQFFTGTYRSLTPPPIPHCRRGGSCHPSRTPMQGRPGHLHGD